jgi:hypothetical protein
VLQRTQLIESPRYDGEGRHALVRDVGDRPLGQVGMLAVCAPAGTEDFFRAAGWDLSRPRPEGWEIAPVSMAAAAAATGQTILGPPLAADQMIPETYLTSLR